MFIKSEKYDLFGESEKCKKVELARRESCFLLKRFEKGWGFVLMLKLSTRSKMEDLWLSLCPALKKC